MKQVMIFLGSILLFLTPFSAFAINEDDTEKKITKFMEQSLDMYNIPGASLGIIENRETIYNNQWGTLSDGSSVTADTPFLIGSLSKPITALAIMKLVEEGKIRLDEPIQSYIPSFSYETASAKQITVMHLLEQTSGISEGEGLKVTDKNRPKELTINQAVNDLSGVSLTYEPGEVYEYNSANYLLLGAIIENVTNQTFSHFVKTTIFEPLSMVNSAADYEGAVQKGYVPGYESWFGKPVESDGFYDHTGAPYGYIASSSNDLLKFLTFMLEGGEIVSDQTLQLLKTPQKEGKTYGYGWHFSKTEHYPYHGGATADFRAQMFFIPEENMAAVVLTNKYNALEDAQVSHIMNGIHSILSGKEPDELPTQSYSIQWSIVGVILVLIIFLIFNLLYFKRKKTVNKKITYSVGIISTLLAVGLIPLFVYVIGVPWKSIRLFSPDIAFLISCLVVLFAINGIMTFIVMIFKQKRLNY